MSVEVSAFVVLDQPRPVVRRYLISRWVDPDKEGKGDRRRHASSPILAANRLTATGHRGDPTLNPASDGPIESHRESHAVGHLTQSYEAGPNVRIEPAETLGSRG